MSMRYWPHKILLPILPPCKSDTFKTNKEAALVFLKVNGKRNEVEVAPDTPLLFRLLPAKRSRRSRISPPQTWASSCSVPGSPRTRLKSDQVKLHTMLLG